MSRSLDPRLRSARALLTLGVSVLARFASVLAMVLVTPALVEVLGAERYGVWALVFSAAAWSSLFGLGVVPALSQRLPALTGPDGKAERDAVLGRAAALQVVMGVAFVALAWLGTSGAILAWVIRTEDPFVLAFARDVGRGVAVVVGVQFPLTLVGTVVQARQEGYVAQVATVVATALTTSGVFFAVGRVGSGTLGALAASGLVLSSGLLLLRGLAVGEPLRAYFGAPTLRGLGALARESRPFWLVSLAAITISHTDYLVLSAWAGPTVVARYATAFALTQLWPMLVLLGMNALWPALVEARAAGDGAWVRRVTLRAAVLTLGLGGVWACGCAVLGQELIELWAGPTVVPEREVLWALSALAWLQASLLVPGRVVTALGGVDVTARAGMLNAAVNLVASLALVRHLGPVGVALGTIVGYLVAGIPMVHKARTMLREAAA